MNEWNERNEKTKIKYDDLCYKLIERYIARAYVLDDLLGILVYENTECAEYLCLERKQKKKRKNEKKTLCWKRFPLNNYFDISIIGKIIFFHCGIRRLITRNILQPLPIYLIADNEKNAFPNHSLLAFII